jgi:hypothetical protein
MKRLLLLLLVMFSLISCFEKNTEDPIESYKFWAGEKPSKDVKVIHGKYWQSGHFTKEYIMYLELNASSNWINELIRQNNLIPDTTKVILPGDAPSWFVPKKSQKAYIHSGFDQGSIYFIDSLNRHLLIYEIQL